MARGANPPDDEEAGMLRMSLLEHLEELRSRILRAMAGVGVAFVLSMFFGDWLWRVVARPAMEALRTLGYRPQIVFTTPTEAFLTVWVKMPMLVSVFLASPWVLYPVWAFVAPGMYRHERRWGATFVIVSAGLFLLGGGFGYFVAFHNGRTFLLGAGKDLDIVPLISVSDYFDLFVEVMVGLGLVFELPALIFLLTLMGVATPSFLLRQSRYAVLLIVVVAAVVTPTTDWFNLMLFAVPMIVLYYAGVGAGYVLVRRREGRGLPGQRGIWWATGAAVVAGAGYVAARRRGFRVASHWPFLAR